jgi:hypothetical protein
MGEKAALPDRRTKKTGCQSLISTRPAARDLPALFHRLQRRKNKNLRHIS